MYRHFRLNYQQKIKKGELIGMKSIIPHTPELKFRNKFLKSFSTLPQSSQTNLIKVFEKFINEQDDVVASKILWMLTYNHFSGLYTLGIREQDKCPNEDIIVQENSSLVKGIYFPHSQPIEIPEEMIEPLKNELRFQRKKIHPNFLVVRYPVDCKEAFNALCNTINDPIITYAATSQCYFACHKKNNIEIERILHLLSCNKKEEQFGGIRSLDFNKQESELLLKYAPKLHDYLEALWMAISTERNFANVSLSDSFEIISTEPDVEDTKGITNPVNSPETNNVDTSLQMQLASLQSTLTVDAQDTRTMSARNILQDAELFRNFISIATDKTFEKSFFEFSTAVKQMKDRGYNYSEVLNDLPHIVAILDVMSILEGA